MIDKNLKDGAQIKFLSNIDKDPEGYVYLDASRYITVGKVYTVVGDEHNRLYVVDDEGDDNFACLEGLPFEEVKEDQWVFVDDTFDPTTLTGRVRILREKGTMEEARKLDPNFAKVFVWFDCSNKVVAYQKVYGELPKTMLAEDAAPLLKGKELTFEYDADGDIISVYWSKEDAG